MSATDTQCPQCDSTNVKLAAKRLVLCGDCKHRWTHEPDCHGDHTWVKVGGTLQNPDVGGERCTHCSARR